MCDETSAVFRDVFDKLHISYDDFVRTTERRHALVVAALWRRLQRLGFIQQTVYRGWYCVSDETFVTDDHVVDGVDPADPQRQCKVSRDSGNVVEAIEEHGYGIELERVRGELQQWFDTSPVVPLERLHEARSMFAHMPALSVSRPRARVAWGLPVPGDESHTIYVWVDALANYLTASRADVGAIVAALDSDARDISSMLSDAWPPAIQVETCACFWPN
jgi:methionyl-tRNA synthetase